ncbi:MAG: SDR family NAD(P)-dependent oxidoreductase [Oscillospiraceae bacterium]|nr:SDR family NAD(P)-dependent oxidoreductase [Oscillospiraceae bacterium]
MKTVLITGLSREMGLGTALAKRYLEDGFKVFGSCRDIKQEHIAALSRDHAGNFFPVPLDLTDLNSIKKAAEIISEHGKLDVLINNATATNGDGNKPLDEGLDTENMLNAYDVNAVGFIRLAQIFLPHFSEGAVLAAITSEQGSMGKCWRDSGIDYGMAKAALNYACVVLQRRLAPKFGLRVLAIHPGWVQTRPAPPKADLSPEESAAFIAKTVANPPPYEAEGNKGVFVWYDGRHFEF